MMTVNNVNSSHIKPNATCGYVHVASMIHLGGKC